MESTPVARREAEVITAIRQRDLVVFEPQDIERFLDISRRNAYRILSNMVDKGLAERLARGTYVLRETYERRESYVIASHLAPASYIGFWSALHYHDMTVQVPRSIFVAVTTQKRPLTVQGQTVQFVRVSPASFFGYGRYGDTVASDPEKTILDCLRLPEYAGGIPHVAAALSADLDLDRLIRYAVRLENGAVAARLGYLLDHTDRLDRHNQLKRLVSSYTKLDPAGPRTNPVAEWKLYANVSLHA